MRRRQKIGPKIRRKHSCNDVCVSRNEKGDRIHSPVPDTFAAADLSGSPDSLSTCTLPQIALPRGPGLV